MTKSASISSHLLSVTIKRWISLILCSVAASLLLFFLSEFKWLQTVFSSYSKIITANIWIYHASAFIAGIAIKVLLDRFRVTHPKRTFKPNFYYPPITISIWLTLIILGFSNFSRVTVSEDFFLMFESQILSQLCLIIIGICTVHLISSEQLRLPFIVLTLISSMLFTILKSPTHQVFELIVISYFLTLLFFIFLDINLTKTKNDNKVTEISKQEVENLTSLEDFQNWFKDDTPINTIDKLEPDYQVYAKRIYKRLVYGGVETKQELAQHIALCGPFGCGKSSIILAVANELKKDTQVNEKVNTKSNWLHCDIATWGIQADHVAQVILTHIIDTIAENLDMCAFRSLPKHYLEAMKGGSNNWQILSALLNKSIDTETCLTDINNVLAVAKINLLITIQDIDRGTPDANEKRLNELASLLERLKKRELKTINVIIAMGMNERYQADIISKTTDISEYILQLDTHSIIAKWHSLNFEKIFKEKLLLTESPQFKSIQEYDNNGKNVNHRVKIRLLNEYVLTASSLITDIRLLKKVMRRIDSCWNKGKLLGEVDLDTLLLTFTLREAEPDLFNSFINVYPRLFRTPNAIESKSSGEIATKKALERISEIIDRTSKEKNKSEFYINYIGQILNISNILKTDKTTLDFYSGLQTQKLNNQLDYTNYLSRILLEDVPEAEIRDQHFLSEFDFALSHNTEEKFDVIVKNILTDKRWQEGYQRFGSFMFNRHQLEDKKPRKLFYSRIISATVNDKNLLNQLSLTWFKNLSIDIIKEDLKSLNWTFKQLKRLNDLMTLEFISEEVSKMHRFYYEYEVGSEKYNDYIFLLKDLYEKIIVEDKSKMICNFAIIFEKFKSQNSEKINFTLYYYLKLFSGANEKLHDTIKSLIKDLSPDENQYQNEYHTKYESPITNTLLKIGKEDNDTWLFWKDFFKKECKDEPETYNHIKQNILKLLFNIFNSDEIKSEHI